MSKFVSAFLISGLLATGSSVTIANAQLAKGLPTSESATSESATSAAPGESDAGISSTPATIPEAESNSAKAPPAVTVASTVEKLLKAKGQHGFRLKRKERKAVMEAYSDRKFAPIWLSDGRLNEKAIQVLAQMGTADADGMRAADYLPPTLESFTDTDTDLADNPTGLAQLELEITRAAITYALHASRGRVEPRKVSRHNSVRPERVGPAKAVEMLASSDRPDRYLAGLLPDYPEYHALKAALASHRERPDGKTFEPIAGGRLIRPGRNDKRIHQIRRRLIELGEYELKVSEETTVRTEQVSTAENALSSPVYDKALFKAIKQFQRKRGLKSGGIIGPNTLAALNGTMGNQADKIIINMERMRWLPQDLGKRHVFVNQAAYRMRFVDADKVVHEARVIVGKARHQTPVMSDEMEHIIFNPYWNVPRSIATKEMLPQLVRNPYYLAERGFQVFYNDGRRRRQIDSTYVDWYSVSRHNFRFHVRQPPGRRNALGKMKFMFPNKNNIYLHDTPTKSLFSRASRAYSHGCVRLQNPDILAKMILRLDRGWNARKIDRMVASGRNQRVNLKSKIPVHLTYFTAWPRSSGEVAFLNDMYKRDKALKQALKRHRIAMN